MILSSFHVKNFRSIVEADFPLSKVTVLLGKNNEGKSNILRAFTIAMRVLESHSDFRSSVAGGQCGRGTGQWHIKVNPSEVSVSLNRAV